MRQTNVLDHSATRCGRVSINNGIEDRGVLCLDQHQTLLRLDDGDRSASQRFEKNVSPERKDTSQQKRIAGTPRDLSVEVEVLYLSHTSGTDGVVDPDNTFLKGNEISGTSSFCGKARGFLFEHRAILEQQVDVDFAGDMSRGILRGVRTATDIGARALTGDDKPLIP